ncbi:MAG: hypothetical protein LQ347_006924, partial [Umbilicaria vellea]
MADVSKPDSPFRIAGLRQFLPLSDDVVSTRGQSLPGLIRSRSTASLHDLRPPGLQRRASRVKRIEEDGQMDLERDGNGGRGGEGRSNAGAQVLMTPQMRSMWLIGNSNPRYQ